MIDATYGAHDNLRELRNEFNKNYQKYIELDLLESLTENAIQNKPSESNDTRGLKLDDKISEKYMKSNLIIAYNNNSNKEVIDQIEFSPNEFKTLPLDLEAKSHLVEKISELIENRLSKLNKFMSESTESDDNDYSETVRMFNKNFEQIQSFKQNSQKSNDDIRLKYEHCLNVAFEVAKLINAMFVNFRLGFYAEENRERCENKILEFKILLGKILSSKSSIMAEIYSEEKLKALKIISDQVDIKSNFYKDKHERMISLINSYDGLGKEFEPILSLYKELKAELERKNFTLDTLKKENF